MTSVVHTARHVAGDEGVGGNGADLRGEEEGILLGEGPYAGVVVSVPKVVEIGFGIGLGKKRSGGGNSGMGLRNWIFSFTFEDGGARGCS